MQRVEQALAESQSSCRMQSEKAGKLEQELSVLREALDKVLPLLHFIHVDTNSCRSGELCALKDICRDPHTGCAHHFENNTAHLVVYALSNCVCDCDCF